MSAAAILTSYGNLSSRRSVLLAISKKLLRPFTYHIEKDIHGHSSDAVICLYLIQSLCTSVIISFSKGIEPVCTV